MVTATRRGTGETDSIRPQSSIERARLLASVPQARPKDDRPGEEIFRMAQEGIRSAAGHSAGHSATRDTV
jgi:hypothetical protein